MEEDNLTIEGLKFRNKQLEETIVGLNARIDELRQILYNLFEDLTEN